MDPPRRPGKSAEDAAQAYVSDLELAIKHAVQLLSYWSDADHRVSSRVSARDAAHGIVLGSPFRAEIEGLYASALERATEAVERALEPWDVKDAPCLHT